MKTATDILETIDNIEADLIEAQANVALLSRLKNAEGDAKRLADALAKAKEELAEVCARNAQAKQDDRFTTFLDIAVVESTPHQSSNVLTNAYSITVTQRVNDGTGEVTKEFTYAGFKALPFEALCYLIVKHPDRIPASIRQLGADPDEAFNEYFMGLRRGFLTVAA
jgi:hypothetical protein